MPRRRCQHRRHRRSRVTRTAMGGLFAGFIGGAAVVFFGLGSQPGAAQQPAGSAIPRTAAGKPNLNGIWQALNTANYDIQAHAAQAGAGDAARPGRTRARDGGAGPRRRRRGAGGQRRRRRRRDSLPAGRARAEEENQANWLDRDPEIKCYLPGVPRATYMPFPFQILQSDKAFFIAYEYAGAVRNIFLKDPGPPPGRFVDGAVGRPVGRRHLRRRR